jgi:hypothetical protein
MNGSDGKIFSNIATTTAAFPLMGGTYGVSVMAATWGVVTLQTLGPDASTWLTAATAFSGNGVKVQALPPGQYRFAVATATAVYAAISGIPQS